MANITVKDQTGAKKFLTGNTVFKITSRLPTEEEEHIYGMVNTKEEFKKKLETHEYISILYVAPVTYQLAYLYGCLNHEKNVSRKEIFTFWYRTVGRSEWNLWFVVYPSEY